MSLLVLSKSGNEPGTFRLAPNTHSPEEDEDDGKNTLKLELAVNELNNTVPQESNFSLHGTGQNSPNPASLPVTESVPAAAAPSSDQVPAGTTSPSDPIMDDLKSGGMLLIQVTMASGPWRLLLVTPQQLQALQNNGQPTSGLLQTPYNRSKRK